MCIRLLTACCAVACLGAFAVAAEPTEPIQFPAFIKQQAAAFRQADVAPKTMDEWEHRRAALKAALTAAWGGFPETRCDLEPRKLGEFQRNGYRVEKLVLQTRPGIMMTANAYVPDKPGRLPAILHVHGHWAGAKQDPVVQSRCIGAAKLGFFVLCVDAFGAGERGIGKNLGEYHGEMVGALLLPVGLPLSGLQVYENMRAVDYLQSRPEVDPNRIGITGASGGGNQTMYAGAMDERLRCVVPTCSVGNYQAYLGAACCMCEVVPGALQFTEEGDVLGLATHRGLMVTSATRDAYQFSVEQAKTSFARAEAIAALYPDAAIRHTIIESEHNYNQPMREAMYGWMTRHLKGEGDGRPIPEPDIQPEDPETLRCFPGDSRPDDFMTLPRFASSEGRRLVSQIAVPATPDAWSAGRQRALTELDEVLGDTPKPVPLNVKSDKDADGKIETLTFDVESGLRLTLHRTIVEQPIGLAVLLDCDKDTTTTLTSDLANTLRAARYSVVVPELRATGKAAVHHDKIGRAPDHNSAEWSLWIGRPLLGQWIWDVRRSLDAVEAFAGPLPKEIHVIGNRSAGVVALCAGATDERIARVITVDSLTSYVSDAPYVGQRLGLMAPAILRNVGDIPQIAALIAPRKLVVAGGVTGDGHPVNQVALREQFKFTEHVYRLIDSSQDSPFQVVPSESIGEMFR